jgi:GNAT superfamily N-acetyltransferase
MVSLDGQPDLAWQAVFLGPGMDAVDGANRVRNLSRATATSFVSARTSCETVACGAASWGHAWLGIHGMRTAVSHQRQGLASRVLAVMAQAAADRGIARAFLQVGAANTKALALHERLGFQRAWAYAYWRRI